MASTAERRGDGPHVGPILSRAHAVITAPIAVVPNYAKRILHGEVFADLTSQDRALDRRNDGSGFLQIEVGIGKADEGVLCGDVMIEHEERLRLSSHGFQRLAGIAEIHDDDSLVLYPSGRRIPVFDWNEPSRWKVIPDRPSGAEPIGTFVVIEHDGGGLRKLVPYAGTSHRGGAYHDAAPRLKRLCEERSEGVEMVDQLP